MNTHQPTVPRFSRRQVVGAGLAGAAISVGAGRIAAAQTTPPTPPLAPTTADVELLTFAMTLELAARDLYLDALAAGAAVGPMIGEGDQAEQLNLFQVIEDNHQEYASVLAGELGLSTGSVRDSALYDDWAAQFSESDPAIIGREAYDLENVLVATHTELMGVLEGLQSVELIASILIIEARHCAVLADVAGLSSDLDVVLDNNALPRTLPASTEPSP